MRLPFKIPSSYLITLSQREGNCSWSHGSAEVAGRMLEILSGNSKLVHLSHLGSRMYTRTVWFFYAPTSTSIMVAYVHMIIVPMYVIRY